MPYVFLGRTGEGREVSDGGGGRDWRMRVLEALAGV